VASVATVCNLLVFQFFFKPLPGGYYVLRAYILASETICFRDISGVCWWIFTKLLSLVHLGRKMNWLGFGVKTSKIKVTLSWRRRPALDPAVKWSFLVHYYASIPHSVVGGITFPALHASVCDHDILKSTREILLNLSYSTDAFWDIDDCCRFWHQNVKVQVTVI